MCMACCDGNVKECIWVKFGGWITCGEGDTDVSCLFVRMSDVVIVCRSTR